MTRYLSGPYSLTLGPRGWSARLADGRERRVYVRRTDVATRAWIVLGRRRLFLRNFE